MKGNLSLLLLVFLPSILTAAPVYNPTTGHWYERVDAIASGITWTDAKAAAEARSYSGAQGYLAPITSDQENCGWSTISEALQPLIVDWGVTWEVMANGSG